MINEEHIGDLLAVERTHLANERTLLAYIRTALALAAAGGVLIRFFESNVILAWSGWLLVITGVLAAGIGIYRFGYVRRQLILRSKR